MYIRFRSLISFEVAVREEIEQKVVSLKKHGAKLRNKSESSKVSAKKLGEARVCLLIINKYA